MISFVTNLAYVSAAALDINRNRRGSSSGHSSSLKRYIYGAHEIGAFLHNQNFTPSILDNERRRRRGDSPRRYIPSLERYSAQGHHIGACRTGLLVMSHPHKAVRNIEARCHYNGASENISDGRAGRHKTSEPLVRLRLNLFDAREGVSDEHVPEFDLALYVLGYGASEHISDGRAGRHRASEPLVRVRLNLFDAREGVSDEHVPEFDFALYVLGYGASENISGGRAGRNRASEPLVRFQLNLFDARDGVSDERAPEFDIALFVLLVTDEGHANIQVWRKAGLGRAGVCAMRMVNGAGDVGGLQLTDEGHGNIEVRRKAGIGRAGVCAMRMVNGAGDVGGLRVTDEGHANIKARRKAGLERAGLGRPDMRRMRMVNGAGDVLRVTDEGHENTELWRKARRIDFMERHRIHEAVRNMEEARCRRGGSRYADESTDGAAKAGACQTGLIESQHFPNRPTMMSRIRNEAFTYEYE